jgi:hypothetical protein
MKPIALVGPVAALVRRTGVEVAQRHEALTASLRRAVLQPLQDVEVGAPAR